MEEYVTKADLYKKVSNIKLNMGFKAYEYKINLIDYCLNCQHIYIKKYHLKPPLLKVWQL